MKTTQNAAKEKIEAKEAIELAHSVSKIVIARGKKVLTFQMAKDPPPDDELESLILGRSGTLRAPTLRRGKTLLVGFSADAYESTLG